MLGKLLGWIVNLIGKLIGLAFLTLVVGILALAGYFYYKSGQPMQVAAAQRIAPGITLREYMRYAHTVWEKADDKSVAKGDNRSCVLVYGIVESIAAVIYSPLQVNHYRAIRGTPAFAQYVEYLNGNVPPDDLLSNPWWKLPETYWWHYENTIWADTYTYLPGGDCRVRPLSPTAHSQPSKP
jgi:hypothetical protein